MENLCLLRTCENKFIINHLTLTAQSNARQVNSNVMPQKKQKETSMYRLLLIALFAISAQGCTPYPSYNVSVDDISKKMFNVPSSGTSQFDNSKYIRMSNMVCSNSVMFELYQDTQKSKKGIVLLKAGSKSITNIGKGKSLLIKLDGKIYSFESTDILTEHETIHLPYSATMQFSHKTYIVPESFIRKTSSSKTFLTKVYLLNNSYIEGKCSPVTLSEAKEQTKLLGSGYEITQEHVDSANKSSTLLAFREFIKMIDATKW